MSKEVIQVGSKIYPFPRIQYETDESYFIRMDFFINALPQTQKDYQNAINMSIVKTNIKLLGCIYKTEIIENMNKLLISSVKNSSKN